MSNRYGFLLAPGAGADAQSAGLKAVDEAVADFVTVERFDFPYRKAGRKAPDRAPVLIEAWRKAQADFCERTCIAPDSVFVGGRSMGGRMASMAVAEGMTAAGLVLLSYPLHPPGQPGKLRVEHLPAVRIPSLFVSGTGDTFGKPDELEHWSKTLGGPVTLAFVEGGDHGMAKHGASVAECVSNWLATQTASFKPDDDV